MTINCPNCVKEIKISPKIDIDKPIICFPMQCKECKEWMIVKGKIEIEIGAYKA